MSAVTKEKDAAKQDAISFSFFNGSTTRDSKCEGVVFTISVTAPPQLGKRIDDPPRHSTIGEWTAAAGQATVTEAGWAWRCQWRG